MSHTPGPWYRKGPLTDEESGVAGGVDVDVVTPPEDEGDAPWSILGDLTVEDADLIAAAPDLLAACRQIVDAHSVLFGFGLPLMLDGKPIDHTGLNQAAELARAAIAKAEGR